MRRFLTAFLVLSMALMAVGGGIGVAEEARTIGYIMGGPELWQQTQMEAAQHACATVGYDFVSLNSDYTAEKELSNAEDLISKGVDAIIMFTVNSETGQQVAQMCNEADIPLFLLDGAIAEGPGKAVTTVAFDFSEIGRAVGEYISVAHPGENAIYITGLVGAGIVEAYVEGLYGALSNGVEIVAQQAADWDRAKAMAVAEDIIASGAEFTVAFVNNEDMASGVILVLEENGLSDSVAVVATGGSDDGIRMIQEGKLAATIAASPAYESAVVVRAIVDYFAGVPVPEHIVTPVMTITADNLDDAVSFAINDNILKLTGLME